MSYEQGYGHFDVWPLYYAFDSHYLSKMKPIIILHAYASRTEPIAVVLT